MNRKKIPLLLSLMFLGLVSLSANAEKSSNSTKCQVLIEDLQSMQRAQSQLLDSMVVQTKEVSSTMKQFSESIGTPKQELQNASFAFLKHHDREEQIVAKFESQSKALIEKVGECLRIAEK